MNHLKIHHWDGSKRTVRFVGYNRSHTALFIRDEQNARQAITLQLPDHFDLHFRQNPIGVDGSPPVEINRVALHLPACFATCEEKEAFEKPRSMEFQCALASFNGAWKHFTIHKCHLEPKDDEKLQLLLNEELARLRRCYEIASRETDAQIAALDPGDTMATEALRTQLRDQFTTLFDGTNGESKPIRVFDVTLDMIRRGWGGLRDLYMEREWARMFGVDLKTIPFNAAAFRTWLEAHAYNARHSTTDLHTLQISTGLCLRLAPWQWEILEATVAYEIRFADGSRCWLSGMQVRPITDSQEMEDFEKLESLSPRSAVETQVPDCRTEFEERFVGALLVPDSALAKGMSRNESDLYNLLVAKTNRGNGKVRSYREIGRILGVSATEVQRRREALEERHGPMIARLLAAARSGHRRGVHPELCNSGSKRRTANFEDGDDPD